MDCHTSHIPFHIPGSVTTPVSSTEEPITPIGGRISGHHGHGISAGDATRGTGSGNGTKRWRTRLRPQWGGAKSSAADAGAGAAGTSASSGLEGFICPQCHMKLGSPAALLAHFHVLHGSGGGRGGGVGHGGGPGGERTANSGGSSDEGGGGSRRSSGGGGGSGRRSWKRSSRRSWRGETISLDHFILALQGFMEEQPHEGHVMARYAA